MVDYCMDGGVLGRMGCSNFLDSGFLYISWHQLDTSCCTSMQIEKTLVIGTEFRDVQCFFNIVGGKLPEEE
jgi:hypothetical protein